MARCWISLMVFVCMYMKAHSCTYGSDVTCVFPCNCENSTEICDPESGECPDSGCKDGPPAGFPWEGPGCRIGNVAHGKPAVQIGTISSYTADRAVDGDAATYAYVDAPSTEEYAEWMVDLQSPHVIDKIIIITKGGHRLHTVSGYVSNNSDYTQHGATDLCATYPGLVPTHVPVTLQCNASNTAQYVSLRNGESSYKRRMTIYEVLVIGYKVASDCTVCGAGGCDDLAGCESCPVGKRRPDCKQDCRENVFGADCQQKCHCRHGTCDSASGVCESGCEDWWVPSTCNVHIPAPNMSHVTPHVSIFSPTSISLQFQQLDIDDNIAEYFEYMAEYNTIDDDYARTPDDLYQPHDTASTENTLRIDELLPDTQYAIRVHAFRDIRTFEWHNEQRRSGVPSQEVHVKFLAQSNPQECVGLPVAMIAGVGAAIVVILVVIAALVGFFCARKCSQNPPQPKDQPRFRNPTLGNDQENHELVQRGNVNAPI